MIPFLTLLACLILLVYRSKERVSPVEFLLLTGGIVAACVGSLIHPGLSLMMELGSVFLLLLSFKRQQLRHLAIGLLIGGSVFGAMERKGEFIQYHFDSTVKSEIAGGSHSVLERSEYLIPGTPTNAGLFTGTYSLSFYMHSPGLTRLTG
jgi:hypothetical protein